MLLSRLLGGFTPGQSEELRKAFAPYAFNKSHATCYS
jgi:DNA polymerase III alpha subunit